MNTYGLRDRAVTRLRRSPWGSMSWPLLATAVLVVAAHSVPAGATALVTTAAAASGVVALRVLAGTRRPTPVVRQEGAVWLGVLTVVVAMWFAAPGAAAFVTGGYTILTCARIAVTAAGLVPRRGRTSCRVALGAAAAGAVAQAASDAILLLTGVASVPAAVVAVVAAVVAVTLPVLARVVAELAVTADQRRVRTALRPLRALLCGEFPEVALVAGRTRHRWHRQAAEIRDGLVLLAPYYDATIARAAAEQSRWRGDDAEHAGAAVHAALIEAAVRAHRSGREPDEPLPEAATRGGRDWTDEMAWLVLVSERLVPAAPEFASANSGGR